MGRESAFWHPFAAMGAVHGNEFVIERGEGVWVWDEDGNRYLDGTAALWYCNVGHGRPEIVEAVAEQMGRLDAYSCFAEFANPPVLDLCDRLAAMAPMDDAKVMLGSGGGDGVEAAAKLARRYWQETGSPERVKLISRSSGYHGTHGLGTSLAGIEANASGWGPLTPHTSVVGHDSVPALEEEIERLGPGTVAAVFVEPVIGAGGVYPPEPGYLEGVAEVCDRTGVLLIADCVITAFGRVGTPMGVERWGLEPDMIVFAKGVTSGYLPLGGVVVSGEVAAPFWADGAAPYRHGATYSGHPTVCAAALANLDILEGEGLIERGRELEGELADLLRPLAEHPLVAEVRCGTGLMAAVELDAELRASDPGCLGALVLAAREEGVLVRALPNAVAVSPPLTIETGELRLLADAISSGLDRLDAPGRA